MSTPIQRLQTAVAQRTTSILYGDVELLLAVVAAARVVDSGLAGLDDLHDALARLEAEDNL